MNNFGDLLGPLIVERLTTEIVATDPTPHSVLTVGSILHFANDGDVVWGSGVNGKVQQSALRFTQLDVRAVRGPKTAEVLRHRGIDVPDVYGDPGLLVPRLFPELIERSSRKTRKLLIVPNLHDFPRWKGHHDVLNPTAKLWHCLNAIAESEQVVATSLHGLIIAEALGIRASMIRPGKEALFKYEDYVQGTGRDQLVVNDDLPSALMNPLPPIQEWNSQRLVDAFPYDSWGRDSIPVAAP